LLASGLARLVQLVGDQMTIPRGRLADAELVTLR
jgi:hypothetical protein